jgi:hypothetical protein
MDNATLKFLVILALAAIVLYLMTRKNSTTENFTVVDIREGADDDGAPPAPQLVKAIGKAAQMPKGIGASSNTMPKPPADTGFFGQFAPDPKELAGQNFVDATRWTSLGVMTSKRNINRDLRPEIPIPKNMTISPWLQSSIDQQYAGKALC